MSVLFFRENSEGLGRLRDLFIVRLLELDVCFIVGCVGLNGGDDCIDFVGLYRVM